MSHDSISHTWRDILLLPARAGPCDTNVPILRLPIVSVARFCDLKLDYPGDFAEGHWTHWIADVALVRGDRVSQEMPLYPRTGRLRERF